MKPETCAYLAGIFDGEGSFVVGVDSQGYHQVFVNVSQFYCDELLDWVLEQLGFGWVDKHASVKRWRCSRASVIKFLDYVQPYLIVKREEAALIRAIVEIDGRSIDPRNIILKDTLVELWKKNRADRKVTRANKTR